MFAEQGESARDLAQAVFPPVQAVQHGLAERVAHHRLGTEPAGPGAVGRQVVLDQRVHQQRVAAAGLVVGGGELAAGGDVELLGEHLGHAGAGQRCQAQPGEVGQAGDLAVEGQVAGPGLGPLGEDHQHPRGADAALQVEQGLLGLGVGELDVVDGQHDRLLAGQVQQVRAQRVQHGRVRLVDREHVPPTVHCGSDAGRRCSRGELVQWCCAAEQLAHHAQGQGLLGAGTGRGEQHRAGVDRVVGKGVHQGGFPARHAPGDQCDLSPVLSGTIKQSVEDTQLPAPFRQLHASPFLVPVRREDHRRLESDSE